MRFPDLVTQFLRPKASSRAQNPQTKTSRAGPMIAWSHVGQPQWTPRRAANLAEEGYRKNVVAYRCVMQIATSCAAVPWVLYDAQGNEIDTHPILDLLAHPNPLQDGVSFMESIYANLQISGNAYIEAICPAQKGSGAPIELYSLRPDRMKVIAGPNGMPQGYQYNVNGQVTNWAADPVTGASNILQLKTFHPLDDWYGMAPMEAALLSVDQHNAAGAWNQALLNQGARPSGALVYAPKDGGPASLSDDQLQRLREEMGQLYQGDRNAGRPLILEGGLDWREMSLSPKDMDWLAGRSAAARDIALAFGVPAQLIGIPDAQTYANYEQARQAFYEETVLPLLTRVIAGVDHWLCPMYEDAIDLDFDPDSISALSDKRQAQWARLQNADFLTRNEKRAAAGYGPVPGGDADDAYDDAGDDSAAPTMEAGNPAGFFNGKFNPWHDPTNGQFTFGPGGAAGDSDAEGQSPSMPDNASGPGIFGLPSNIRNPKDPNLVPAQYIEGGEELAAEADELAAETKPAVDELSAEAAAARQKLIDILAPDGQPIGAPGIDAKVRLLPGGEGAAEQMFSDLTQGGEVSTPFSYNGTRYTMPDGSYIGYRPDSNSGEPTIDVNVGPLKNVIKKLKFVGGEE